MLIENRLDEQRITEGTSPVGPRFNLRGWSLQSEEALAVNWRSSAWLVTAKAASAFTGLEVRDTSHALNGFACLVYSLEIDGLASRRTKIC